MPDKAVKSSPESTSVNALRLAAYELDHPSGPITVFYEAKADMPSFVASVMASSLAANKNHVTFVNKTNQPMRIRKIKVVANITSAVTGAMIMLTVEALQSPFPSNGTLITPRKLNFSGQNLPNLPSPLEVRANPTTNVNIPADWVFDACNIIVEEAVTTVNTTQELLKKESELSCLIVNQDEGFIIKQGAIAGAGQLNFFIYFTLG